MESFSSSTLSNRMGNNWDQISTDQSNEFSSKPVVYYETSTPTQAPEPSTFQSSPTTSNPDTTMSGSDSESDSDSDSACGAFQHRRIPRLVFKLKSVTNEDGTCSAKEKEETSFNPAGNRVWTLETKEDAEKPNTGSAVVTELSGTESRFEPCGGHDNTMVTEFKGKRKLDFDGVSVSPGFGVEGGEGFFNLQTGERTVKRRTEGIDDLGDGNLVCEAKREGKDEEGEKVRRFRTEEKGKGKLVEDDLVLSNMADGVELIILDEEPSFYGYGSVKSKRRERKDKVEWSCIDVVELDSEPESTENLVQNNAVYDRRREGQTNVGKRTTSDVSEDVVIKNSEKDQSAGKNCSFRNSSVDNVGSDAINTSVNQTKGGEYMQKFRNVARKHALKYAVFNEKHPSIIAAESEGASSSVKTKSTNVNWVPKQLQDRQRSNSKPLFPPSLLELSMKILLKNADAITSLENIPDELRHKLSQWLCDSRRMNCRFFDLLVRGSPTEIRLRDCSWLTEEQFTKSFEDCDAKRLMVLQLDQCGRCLPDYVLQATLARSSKCLPALTILSLTGGCRISDVGLTALVSSAPALRSVNLSRCALLTSISIKKVADSLGSILKELYIDDCNNIDAKLILPALKNLKQLEVLSLARIQTVCDGFIREYITACGRNMKELVLTDCVELTDSSLKVIAETCSQLCTLDIVNLWKLTDSAVGYLANGCQAIQTLKLGPNSFSDEAIAAYLETSGVSLKELSLNSLTKVGDKTATSLARRSRNLIRLDLSWCRKLTDEDLGLIVDSCLSLRVLKLFGCTQVTSVFLDGHSNPNVEVIGLKLSSILKNMKLPDPQEKLKHSSL